MQIASSSNTKHGLFGLGGSPATTTAVVRETPPQEQSKTTMSRGFKQRKCICARGNSCAGLSAAFYILNDLRGGYVEVPPTKQQLLSGEEVETLYKLRDSYCRHVGREKSLKDEKRYAIALHHFHPQLVKECKPAGGKGLYVLPKALSARRAKQLNLKVTEQDRVWDPTIVGDYFVVPSYDFQQTRIDLQDRVKLSREEADDQQDLQANRRTTSPEMASSSVKVASRPFPVTPGISPITRQGSKKNSKSMYSRRHDESSGSFRGLVTPPERIPPDRIDSENRNAGPIDLDEIDDNFLPSSPTTTRTAAAVDLSELDGLWENRWDSTTTMTPPSSSTTPAAVAKKKESDIESCAAVIADKEDSSDDFIQRWLNGVSASSVLSSFHTSRTKRAKSPQPVERKSQRRSITPATTHKQRSQRRLVSPTPSARQLVEKPAAADAGSYSFAIGAGPTTEQPPAQRSASVVTPPTQAKPVENRRASFTPRFAYNSKTIHSARPPRAASGTAAAGAGAVAGLASSFSQTSEPSKKEEPSKPPSPPTVVVKEFEQKRDHGRDIEFEPEEERVKPAEVEDATMEEVEDATMSVDEFGTSSHVAGSRDYEKAAEEKVLAPSQVASAADSSSPSAAAIGVGVAGGVTAAGMIAAAFAKIHEEEKKDEPCPSPTMEAKETEKAEEHSEGSVLQKDTEKHETSESTVSESSYLIEASADSSTKVKPDETLAVAPQSTSLDSSPSAVAVAAGVTGGVVAAGAAAMLLEQRSEKEEKKDKQEASVSEEIHLDGEGEVDEDRDDSFLLGTEFAESPKVNKDMEESVEDLSTQPASSEESGALLPVELEPKLEAASQSAPHESSPSAVVAGTASGVAAAGVAATSFDNLHEEKKDELSASPRLSPDDAAREMEKQDLSHDDSTISVKADDVQKDGIPLPESEHSADEPVDRSAHDEVAPEPSSQVGSKPLSMSEPKQEELVVPPSSSISPSEAAAVGAVASGGAVAAAIAALEKGTKKEPEDETRFEPTSPVSKSFRQKEQHLNDKDDSTTPLENSSNDFVYESIAALEQSPEEVLDKSATSLEQFSEEVLDKSGGSLEQSSGEMLDESAVISEDSAAEKVDISKQSSDELIDESADLVRPLKLLSEVPLDYSESLAVLTGIESKRRLWFMSELDATKKEWDCYQQILHNSILETDRVEQLVRGSFQSLEAYGSVIMSIHNDSYVDDQGKVVEETRKQRKLANYRRKVDRVSVKVDQIDGQSSLLKPIFDSLLKLKENLDEHLPPLEEFCQCMTQLKSEVAVAAVRLEKSGDLIVRDLQRAEANVQDVWECLERLAKDKEDGKVDNNLDPWLLEVDYRSAVYMKMSTWKARSAELANLYQDVVKMDEQRGNRLKEILLAFLPKRRRLFLRIQEALEPASFSLEECRGDKDRIDAAIDDALEKLSLSKLKNSMLHRSSILNRSRSKQPKWDEGRFSNELLMKDNHFRSSLVHNLQVVETKTIGSDVWELALAATTIDHRLHVFVTQEDDMLDCDLSNASVDDLVDTFAPSDAPDVSLLLPQCKLIHSKGSREVEIDIIGDKPLQRFLKRKVHLRMVSAEEAQRWVDSNKQQREILRV